MIIVTVFVVLSIMLMLMCLGHDFLDLHVRLIIVNIIIIESLDRRHPLPALIIVVLLVIMERGCISLIEL